jgi:hypothetical protein
MKVREKATLSERRASSEVQDLKEEDIHAVGMS